MLFLLRFLEYSFLKTKSWEVLTFVRKHYKDHLLTSEFFLIMKSILDEKTNLYPYPTVIPYSFQPPFYGVDSRNVFSTDYLNVFKNTCGHTLKNLSEQMKLSKGNAFLINEICNFSITLGFFLQFFQLFFHFKVSQSPWNARMFIINLTLCNPFQKDFKKLFFIPP